MKKILKIKKKSVNFKHFWNLLKVLNFWKFLKISEKKIEILCRLKTKIWAIFCSIILFNLTCSIIWQNRVEIDQNYSRKLAIKLYKN